MKLSDFDYELPEALIAQEPAPQRTASRLLHLNAATGEITDRMFSDLPGLVDNRDALVINDTRVMKARLHGTKDSGGKIEVFVERILAEREASAMIRAGHPPKVGAHLKVGDGVDAEILGRDGELYRLRFAEPVAPMLRRCGSVPLPPYIRHPASATDTERYQTVYADRAGAVAAPTAGLHFDEALLKKVVERGATVNKLTLHVGAGTFQPIRTEDVEAHRMHKEHYEIPQATLAAIARRRVLAVGTTTLRALETSAVNGARNGETDIYIYPGFRFQVVERLLTNFHLPKSSLLLLVSAFGGVDNIRRAYAHAVKERYRFFSYGDAMLIERAP